MSPAIDALRVACAATVAHHLTRRNARLARAAAWMRQADAYQRCAPFASMHASRAEALAIAARRRGVAWAALAQMDADDAARHRAQSLTARRMCGTLTARVWGGRA